MLETKTPPHPPLTPLFGLVGTGIYSQTNPGALLSLPKLMGLGGTPDSNWTNAHFARVFGLAFERVKSISLQKV